ncbi:aminopeptidase P family protein [Rhodobacteraceae bacterium NNCM2]|nr:aminopeptidase P family protein [Coraliihabitans acroporae]
MFQNFETTSDPGASADRIGKLRDKMEQKGITGLIVPLQDVHQGETIAPCDQRLSWLTGFTGSAGSCVVLMGRAVMFVDGRYTLQAAQQCDPNLFEVVPVHEVPVSKWLGAEVKQGDVIGIDPWLHGKDEVEKLSDALEQAGARLTLLPENLIDGIWDDRPPPPGGAVRIHGDDISGESSHAKRERLGEGLRKAGADAVFMNLPDSLAWLCNIRGTDLAHSPVALGFGLLHADGSLNLYMDPDKFDGAVREHLGNEVTIDPVARIDDLWQGLSGKKVMLDRQSCPVGVADRLEHAGAEVLWGKDPCIAAKAVKNPAELEGMRAAHQIDGAAVVRFLHWLDTQPEDAELTEIDLVKRLEEFRVEAGIHDVSFDTICGAGPNGAIIHYRVTWPTNRTLVRGETVLIDSGGQYENGTTDITRTVAFGPVDAAVIEPFTRVLKGMISLSMTRWPKGLCGRDIDPFARRALWQAGYDYDHGTGHGVGACLNVHEGPASISRRGTVPLEAGMILSNEPGYYREGAFGIRIENLVAVHEASVPEGGDREMLGFETLTFCPIDRRLIDPSLLTTEELEWLDAYHARVLADLAPMLDPEVVAWLTAACAPITGEN